MGDFLVVDDGYSDRVIAAEAGVGKQRGDLNVSVGLCISDLAEERFLRVEREDRNKES